MAVNSLACPRLISLPVQRREKRTDAAPHLPPHRKRESVDIDSAQSVFGTAMDLLRHYESLVDRGILKDRHNNPETRKSTFRKTVECIQQIVTLKLYRAKCNSLETYFASEWKISRAQVYRFLDCAVILEDLADFEEVPCKERLCRALRKLTKSKKDLRRLWSAVLQRFPAAERDSITSTAISTVWRELQQEGSLVEPIQNDPNRPRRRFALLSESMVTDVDKAVTPYCVKRNRPTSAKKSKKAQRIELSGNIDQNTISPENTIRNVDNRLSSTAVAEGSSGTTDSGILIERRATERSADDPAQVQSTLTLLQKLSERGISLQPFIRDDFFPGVQTWRFVTKDNRTPSKAQHGKLSGSMPSHPNSQFGETVDETSYRNVGGDQDTADHSIANFKLKRKDSGIRIDGLQNMTSTSDLSMISLLPSDNIYQNNMTTRIANMPFLSNANTSNHHPSPVLQMELQPTHQSQSFRSSDCLISPTAAFVTQQNAQSVNSTDNQTDIADVLNRIKRLSEQGIELQPMIHGIWESGITKWRFVKMDETGSNEVDIKSGGSQCEAVVRPNEVDSVTYWNQCQNRMNSGMINYFRGECSVGNHPTHSAEQECKQQGAILSDTCDTTKNSSQQSLYNNALGAPSSLSNPSLLASIIHVPSIQIPTSTQHPMTDSTIYSSGIPIKTYPSVQYSGYVNKDSGVHVDGGHSDSHISYSLLNEPEFLEVRNRNETLPNVKFLLPSNQVPSFKQETDNSASFRIPNLPSLHSHSFAQPPHHQHQDTMAESQHRIRSHSSLSISAPAIPSFSNLSNLADGFQSKQDYPHQPENGQLSTVQYNQPLAFSLPTCAPSYTENSTSSLFNFASPDYSTILHQTQQQQHPQQRTIANKRMGLPLPLPLLAPSTNDNKVNLRGETIDIVDYKVDQCIKQNSNALEHGRGCLGSKNSILDLLNDGKPNASNAVSPLLGIKS